MQQLHKHIPMPDCKRRRTDVSCWRRRRSEQSEIWRWYSSSRYHCQPLELETENHHHHHHHMIRLTWYKRMALLQEHVYKVKQESCAIAKMTARCAVY